MMIREEVFARIEDERNYQDKLNTYSLSIGGELTLLRKYLRDAEDTFAETFGDPTEQPTMDIVRKLAAICVRAIERNGCPLRDIAGSLKERGIR